MCGRRRRERAGQEQRKTQRNWNDTKYRKEKLNRRTEETRTKRLYKKIREQKPEHSPGNLCGRKAKTLDKREENEKGRRRAHEKEMKLSNTRTE